MDTWVFRRVLGRGKATDGKPYLYVELVDEGDSYTRRALWVRQPPFPLVEGIKVRCQPLPGRRNLPSFGWRPVDELVRVDGEVASFP